jgi:hypothetical protein
MHTPWPGFSGSKHAAGRPLLETSSGCLYPNDAGQQLVVWKIAYNLSLFLSFHSSLITVPQGLSLT